MGPQRPLPRERKELQGHHGPFAPGKKRGKEPGAGGKGSRHHIHAALPPLRVRSQVTSYLLSCTVLGQLRLSRHSLDKTSARETRLRGLPPENSQALSCHENKVKGRLSSG